MKQLFLFNPENDIALGLGLPHITPPQQAALLHKAGAMIPFWLGNIGDYILITPPDIELANRWCELLLDNIGLSGPTPISQVNSNENFAMHPWGWSHDAISQFEKFGVDKDAFIKLRDSMPNQRELSHRRTSLRFLKLWSEEIMPLRFPMPIEANSTNDVELFVRNNGDSILKSPWSSSGRGVFPITTSTLTASISRINGIIKNQGSIIVEPLLPKIQDFAMLFNYENGIANFVGYSLFFNSTATNYGGNFVASNEAIVKKISKWIKPSVIDATKTNVAKTLAKILGNNYSGPLGVDMMICGREDNAWIDPCVEINLRYTMGFVAKGIFDKLGKEGIMSIFPKINHQDSSIKKEDKPIRLAPENDWFDFIFYQNT